MYYLLIYKYMNLAAKNVKNNTATVVRRCKEVVIRMEVVVDYTTIYRTVTYILYYSSFFIVLSEFVCQILISLVYFKTFSYQKQNMNLHTNYKTGLVTTKITYTG